jgi:uncharacterized membrane protein YheB (UPF0754 family)
MEFDILIPTQEDQVAKQIIKYVKGRYSADDEIQARIARDIARSYYDEAMYCDKPERMEYWRQVLMCLD